MAAARPDDHFPLGASTVPPLALQSASLVMIQPLPLHEFSPAQLWPPPPHAPLPLQSLPPTHFTLAAVPPPPPSAANAWPATNSPATAVAINTPLICLFTAVLLLRVLRSAARPMRVTVAREYEFADAAD